MTKLSLETLPLDLISSCRLFRTTRDHVQPKKIRYAWTAKRCADEEDTEEVLAIREKLASRWDQPFDQEWNNPRTVKSNSAAAEVAVEARSESEAAIVVQVASSSATEAFSSSEIKGDPSIRKPRKKKLRAGFG